MKKIVTVANEASVDAAIEESMELTPTPREFVQLKATTKKMNKLVSQILLEDIHFEGKDLDIIVKDMKKLMSEGQDFLNRYDDESFSAPMGESGVETYEESSFQ